MEPGPRRPERHIGPAPGQGKLHGDRTREQVLADAADLLLKRPRGNRA
ncbi:hypothetical protein [Streptomyces cavernicola]|uniref:TetR family transcriptional regulator n=1 Tax=Streptomyces cavernicola TaxID=3043613 RepID=A0ABT6S9C2_9ACTN|nr:hypothetical protein [Streptomyces sp. B-S-A6]MDI3404698.1 hypothetical protein [Streptomyces sp. B-S-A6]